MYAGNDNKLKQDISNLMLEFDILCKKLDNPNATYQNTQLEGEFINFHIDFMEAIDKATKNQSEIRRLPDILRQL